MSREIPIRAPLDIPVRWIRCVMARVWGKRCPRCGVSVWGTPYCRCGAGISLSDLEAIFVILTVPSLVSLFLRAFQLGVAKELYRDLRFPV